MSIATLSTKLLNMLKEYMSPVLDSERIGLASPDTAVSRYKLGLHLYAISEDPNLRITERFAVDTNVMQRPPMCLELRYMVTPYAGIKAESLDDHKLLERVMRIMYDIPSLEPYSPLQPSVVPRTKIELLSLDTDEISRIWHFENAQQRLSLYYRLAPVPLGSGIQETVPRVADAEFTLEVK